MKKLGIALAVVICAVLTVVVIGLALGMIWSVLLWGGSA